MSGGATFDRDGVARPRPHQAGCFLCVACSGDERTPTLDIPLRRSPGVGALVAASGPLELGYVLIVPERHFTDIASALRGQPGFLAFVDACLEEYGDLFGDYSFWEHGSPATAGQPSSGCVEHAHLNVIPRTPLTRPRDSRTATTWAEVARRATSPYLLTGSSCAAIEFGTDSHVSQHYRREWARHTGHADLWDYAVGGIAGLQRATVERYANVESFRDASTAR